MANKQIESVVRKWTGSAWNMGGRHVKDVPQYIAVDSFDSTYYSGLDISIYFDAIFIDELVNLQFQEMEQVRPRFGYADYTFRDVARGARMVSGLFTVNFKNSMYMQRVLSTMRQDNGAAMNSKLTELGASWDRKNKTNLVDSMANGQKTLTQLALAGDFTLEDFLQKVSPKETNPLDTFNQQMNELDAAIWGVNNKGVVIGGGDSFQEPGLGSERTAESRRGIHANAPKFAGPKKGFDIVIKYGQPEDPISKDQRSGWGTAEVIRNCHITGSSKAIDDSGKNTLEVFQFIGSTLV